MNKDEAIHKALKVLNCLNNDRVYETAWVKGAINACEEALEQPAEPRLVSYAPDGSTCTLNIDGEEVYFNREQLAQEPVALIKHENGNYSPKHQWQGLTDDEMEKIMHYLNMPVKFSGDIKSFARAIEQALKEKNHV
jgi:hypothetical protein